MSLEASTRKGYWKVQGDPRRGDRIFAASAIILPDIDEWFILVTTSKCSAVHTALRRLSDSQYDLLESFRSEYPSLHLERMGRSSNAFMLFRSHFVARVARQNDGGNDSKVNQTTLSSQAGKVWKTVVPPSTKKPHQDWAARIRKLWHRMYPHGLPPAAMKGNANRSGRKHSANPAFRREPRSSRRAKYHKMTPSSPSSSQPKFQPFPSPLVSDEADFEESILESYSDEEASFFDEFFDSDDGEYLSTNSSRQHRSLAIRASTRKRPEHQLLTPTSTTRELCPSPSPDLVEPKVPEDPPSSPTFCDISLAELNDDECSTFSNCSIVSEFSNHFDQIAVGYSFEEHINNTIMDWDQSDISDIDPVSLDRIIDTPYSSNFTIASPSDEAGSDLDLLRFY